MKREKSCGAVIYDLEKKKVLLIHQVQGHWCFPKGHVENDETEEETALREIKEETGLDVQLDTNFRLVTTYSPQVGVMKDVIYFVAYVSGGHEEVQESEVSEMKWVSYNEAKAGVTFENDLNIFLKSLQYIKMKEESEEY